MTIGPSNNDCRETATRTGFTLLELILVMVTIGVILAISAPSLRGFFASRQTADAATNICALTKYARTQAILQGCIWRLNVDPSSGTYQLTMQQRGAFVNLETDMGREFLPPEGATITLQLDTASPVSTSLGIRSGGTLSQQSSRGSPTMQLGAGRNTSSLSGPWVQFYPNGRNDPATIEIRGRQGELYRVISPSATEPFYVAKPGEAP